MNLLATTGATTPAESNDRVQAEAQRAQLARLAHEFEAMFLSEMLRGMRESMVSDKQDEGLGNETMTDTFDSELGLSLSKSGGFGLATLMLDALAKQGPGSGQDMTPGAALTAYTSATTPLPTTVPATNQAAGTVAAASPGGNLKETLSASLSAAQPGPVTSPFGWRSDPFTGETKFHAGTDIRMAYGHEVQAVAPGRVASVGDRQGYGLTVVIDHGNGLETRYAHLADASVREGDTVEAGQVVARSGNSGRSTAPHLHLEARQNGRAVDMTTLLKDSSLVADSYADRSHVRSGQ